MGVVRSCSFQDFKFSCIWNNGTVAWQQKAFQQWKLHKKCGHVSDADHNAAKNMATGGCLVNQPEKSNMFSGALHIEV
jgi:hypothetical protein